MKKSVKQWFELIGLFFLLAAFGWQCWEEQASQIKYEGYVFELNEKLQAIWMGVYDEAMNSDRYHDNISVYTNFKGINENMRDWGEIKEGLDHLNKQESFFFWCRVVLYLLGSACVIVSKWPKEERL